MLGKYKDDKFIIYQINHFKLRLLAQIRNISDYENKSKEDLIKALREQRPKLRINKNKLKEI